MRQEEAQSWGLWYTDLALRLLGETKIYAHLDLRVRARFLRLCYVSCLRYHVFGADSKTLTEEKREKLFDVIQKSDYIGWMVVSLSAAELSNKMLQRCARFEGKYRAAYIQLDAHYLAVPNRTKLQFSYTLESCVHQNKTLTKP